MQSMEQKRQKLVEEFRKVCADWSILIMHSSLFNFKCLCLVFDFKSFIFVENHSYIFFSENVLLSLVSFLSYFSLIPSFGKKKSFLCNLFFFIWAVQLSYCVENWVCCACMIIFFLIFLSGWAVCLLIVVDLALDLKVLLSGKGRIVKLGEENPRNIQNAVTSNHWWQ